MSFRGRRADLMLGAYEWFARRAAIHPNSRRGRRFSSFGQGSIMCFPPSALFGEHAIKVGSDTMIGPFVSLSAGMGPNQELLSDRIVEIGDRVLIGRGSSIVGHFHIAIENDVFFGPNVYVTDQNHGFDDLTIPIGKQSMPEEPVRIGAGSWVGTNSVILPGVNVGKHVAIGAGSIVTSDLPDNSVAVGSPARVIQQF
ncbi:MAG: acyltransferase [Acidimicrobiales bacterium]|nr:acyltransferase [Acidimicrobiales bacterium]MDP6298349.1 acyltransferase [Acidimicrobiales bacterium]HJM28269.1 acyltransferase [Acidimicrobiales bacterium]HJM97741.1 acyltransferase [Acidimicrobiales bacterium]